MMHKITSCHPVDDFSFQDKQQWKQTCDIKRGNGGSREGGKRKRERERERAREKKNQTTKLLNLNVQPPLWPSDGDE